MKNLITVLILTAILYSCGSDITGPGTNPPPVNNDSLIFSLDSITVILDSQQVHIIDSQAISNSIKKFRVQLNFKHSVHPYGTNFIAGEIQDDSIYSLYTSFHVQQDGDFDTTITLMSPRSFWCEFNASIPDTMTATHIKFYNAK